MADNDDAYQIAADLLDSIQDRFATAGVPLPERAYVHAGQVADDIGCPDGGQLVVALRRVFSGFPGAPRTGDAWENPVVSAEYEIRLLRCVPTMSPDGRPPTVDQLNGAGMEILTDATVLPRALLGMVREHDLGECRSVALSDLTPIGPEGGAGGVSMVVQVDLT